MRLTACVTVRGSCTVVILGGYSDLSTRDQLRDVLNAAAKGTSHLVVDMSRLGFMDSTGLGVLVDVHKRLSGRGGKLALAAPQPIVAKVLAISGLDQVLDLYPSVALAIARPVGEGEPTAP
ncbi:MAG: STAS domain-containing protein [Micromonosporaceae bacterium]